MQKSSSLDLGAKNQGDKTSAIRVLRGHRPHGSTTVGGLITICWMWVTNNAIVNIWLIPEKHMQLLRERVAGSVSCFRVPFCLFWILFNKREPGHFHPPLLLHSPNNPPPLQKTRPTPGASAEHPPTHPKRR